ncbi:732_t:CDS:2, partial [Racocetra fulgida]
SEDIPSRIEDGLIVGSYYNINFIGKGVYRKDSNSVGIKYVKDLERSLRNEITAVERSQLDDRYIQALERSSSQQVEIIQRQGGVIRKQEVILKAQEEMIILQDELIRLFNEQRDTLDDLAQLRNQRLNFL